MKRIIAYSLWGDDPKYTLGAIANVQGARKIFPEWITRFYCGMSVPKNIIEQLRGNGAEVVLKDESSSFFGTFWRFEAMTDATVERVIFRDTDSRLTERELAAVEEWVNSGLTGHIMRDHPNHSMLMLAGMWGCKPIVDFNLAQAVEAFRPTDSFFEDQRFLGEIVYPLLCKKGVLIHDSFFRHEAFSKSFPSARWNDYAFVGEIFDANGERSSEWKIIKEFDTSLKKRIAFKIQRYKRYIKDLLRGKTEFI